ncbi:MAG: patatin-like phospholipase family protein [Hyphomicrobiaceae bacterium]
MQNTTIYGAALTKPPAPSRFRRLSREQHLFGPGPKRILALDGGGVLGVVEIAFLEQIETALRRQHGDDPAFRLADYFDLIGGTSTGSLIATCLALGASVAEVKALYFDLAPKIFGRQRMGGGVINPVYDLRGLVGTLQYHLGDRTLESDDLMTGLAIIAKRLDTASAWVLLNSRKWSYWEDQHYPDPTTGKPSRMIGNRHYLLRELVRASAAAPLYFEPQRITVAELSGDPTRNLPQATETATFVDGALTPHNNPALQLLMLARMTPYGLNWRTGNGELLMVSIGRGWRRPKLGESGGWIERMMPEPVWFAYHSMLGLSRDCSVENVKILQWLSESAQPWPINGEVGGQQGDLLLHDAPDGGPPELLRFQRYDVDLPFELDDFVNPAVMQPAYERAAAAASAGNLSVKDDHFPITFNLSRQRSDPPAFVKDTDVDKRPTPPTPLLVGVTGHRWNRIPKSDLPRIRSQTEHVLAEIESLNPRRTMALMSGLAEGADRIVAELALARGWQLVACLPFSRENYEGDFESLESREEFAALCARSSTVVEAAQADAFTDRNQGYVLLGQTIVSAVSSLVAVWDGEAPNGPGGTVEVIARALSKRIPVYWIGTGEGAELKRL